MARIGWVEGIGYLASVLVFCTFYMKTMIPLRGVAIASNLVFMTYGIAGGLYPVFVLHVVLLPLNCIRLLQVHRLIRKVRTAARGDLSPEWLIPLMTRQRYATGDVLFRRGDEATSMCMVLSGSVRLIEIGVVLGPGGLIGEMGLFAPDNRRTGTAVCESRQIVPGRTSGASRGVTRKSAERTARRASGSRPGARIPALADLRARYGATTADGEDRVTHVFR